ncbi:MAG: cytochrome d ubiquinol oxidase subunit II [Spirochaetes bacterium]|nr:cytochrome d ubiquinol oxidase subunit II [Spirochaetota bacterium]
MKLPIEVLMETHQILQVTWFCIIGFLFTGYTILDGFDLGIGITLPFLSGSEADTKRLLTAIGPVWDGNEVWLVTGGAALFAAFPQAYATVFSGFYLALMLLLLALIFRAVSIEFWFLDERRRPLWGRVFTIGSALAALLLGVALGNIVYGIPLDYDMNFIGSFFTLLRPFPLLIGLLGFAAIALQGCSYAIQKTDDAISARAKSVAATVWLFYALLLAAALIASALFLPGGLSRWGVWLLLAAAAASLLYFRVMLHRGRDRLLFILSSSSIAFLWGIAGTQLYPNLVRASEGFDITIFSSSSSALTLKLMLVFACIGMPLVIVYTAYVYRVFKGKVTD